MSTLQVSVKRQVKFSLLHFIFKNKHCVKKSSYGVFSGPYFPTFGLNTDNLYFSVFRPNAGKYRSEKTPYLDTFHAVKESDTSNGLSFIFFGICFRKRRAQKRK